MTTILFHDVDGCLNPSSGKTLPFELEDFDESHQSSLAHFGQVLDASPVDVMALNTGRSLHSTQIIAEAINSPKVKYLISEHGAIGYRLDKNELIDFEQLAKDLPEGNGVYQSVASIPKLIDWYRVSGADLLTEAVGGHATLAAKFANLTVKIPDGVSGTYLSQCLKEIIEDSPSAGQTFVYHVSESDGYVDVMSEVDKGSGVRLICLLEAEQSAELRTFAVGNGMNDTPMFEQVQRSICPANSELAVKHHCGQSGGLVSQYEFIDASLDWLQQL